MRRLGRLLVFLPTGLFALWSTTVNAEPIYGLNAYGYTWNENDHPPTRSDNAFPTCGNEIENNINRNYEGEPFQQCPDDFFLLHYAGYITIPENETISFMVAGDDGATVKIGLVEFGDWDPKGCSWSVPTSEPFPGGTYELDGWFYEYGGGSCYMLAWNIDGYGWEIVPDEAFTREPFQEDPSTTTEEPTTTLPEPSTTLSEPSTTLQTTTIPQSSSTTSSSTSTSTTTTTSSTTTTTEAPSPPPATLPQPPETMPAPPTTLPASPITVSEPPETIPEPIETLPEPETTEALPPDTLEAPPETVPEPPDTMPAPPDTEPETPLLPPTTLESRPEEGSDPSLNDELLDSVLEELESATPAQIVELLEELLDYSITSEQSIALLTEPQVVANLSVEQATELFDTLNPDDLSDSQAAELVEILNTVPDEIKAAFEEEINVFGGSFDEYVPEGSAPGVTVAVRRALVAVAGLSLALPLPVASRRQ
jgi:hypothetical protein